MKTIVLLVSMLAMSSVVQAQTIQKWTMRTYIVGAAQPLSAPFDLLTANVTCGVDPNTIVPAGMNPSKAVWDDVAQAGKVCVWVDPGNGPLLSTPFGGNYEVTLTATNSAATSPESVRVPFTHPGVAPLAPTGVKPAK